MFTLHLTALASGFIILTYSADRFVSGASGLARLLGISPLVIGLVVVGFGTSAPEMLVSAVAAYNGSSGIAIGNAIGSNITNIGLVLGVSAILVPLTVHSEILRREFPILLSAMLVVCLLMMDMTLDRIDGAVMLTGLVVTVYWIVGLAIRSRKSDPLFTELVREIPGKMSMTRALLFIGIGLGGLLLGARFVVWAAVEIAQGLGISDLVIGLTVVAVGTSLPELFASVTSVLKNEHDIAIGNVMGSNIFNILGVVGISCVIRPATYGPSVLMRDYAVMTGFTIALFAISYGFRGEGVIKRDKGVILVTAFVIYLFAVYFQTDPL
jgi:cation:H+ antiporter